MKNLSQLRRPGQAATPRAREPGPCPRSPIQVVMATPRASRGKERSQRAGGSSATPRAREPGSSCGPAVPRGPATPPALDPATAGVAVDRLAEVESIR